MNLKEFCDEFARLHQRKLPNITQRVQEPTSIQVTVTVAIKNINAESCIYTRHHDGQIDLEVRLSRNVDVRVANDSTRVVRIKGTGE